MDLNQENEHVFLSIPMQYSAIFEEIGALGPMRVQKVYELFKSILVIELYAYEHGRLFLVFDKNAGSPSFHVQKQAPRGEKSVSSLILTLKKHAVGRALWIIHDELSCKAIINAQEHDLVLHFTFAPYRALLSKEPAGTYKAPLKRTCSLKLNLDLAERYKILSEERFYNQALNEQKKLLARELKKKQNLLVNISQDLFKAQNIINNESSAELLRDNLHLVKKGMKEALVLDYSSDPPAQKLIKLDERLSPADYVAALYKKIKRAKRGISHIAPRKEELAREIASLTEKLIKLDQTGPDLALNQQAQKKVPGKKKQKIPARLPYRVFTSSDHIPIWVGKSAKDNDDLSLHYANGNDWWFHARSSAGSHVVVKDQKDALPSATLIEAAMLAAHYSALCDEPAPEIVYTRAKYVRKPKGLPPGKVIIGQEKSLIVRMDAEALGRLLKR